MNRIKSAIEGLEQQLERSFALVASARSALLDSGVAPHSVVVTLLDMAEDELSHTAALQKLNELVGRGSP